MEPSASVWIVDAEVVAVANVVAGGMSWLSSHVFVAVSSDISGVRDAVENAVARSVLHVGPIPARSDRPHPMEERFGGPRWARIHGRLPFCTVTRFGVGFGVQRYGTTPGERGSHPTGDPSIVDRGRLASAVLDALAPRPA